MNTPEEFELNGQLYRAQKLPTLDQDFVARKLVPIVASIIPLLQSVAREAANGGPMAGAILKMDTADLMPLARGISGLPEEDAKAVYSRCLSHIQRGMKSPAGVSWANIWSKTADTLMFDDIELHTMYMLVAHVVKKDLGPFIDALFSGSTGAGLLPTATS